MWILITISKCITQIKNSEIQRFVSLKSITLEITSATKFKNWSQLQKEIELEAQNRAICLSQNSSIRQVKQAKERERETGRVYLRQTFALFRQLCRVAYKITVLSRTLFIQDLYTNIYSSKSAYTSALIPSKPLS